MNEKENQALRFAGRIIAETYYNFQRARIMQMNRFRDIVFRKDQGIALDEKQEKKSQKDYAKEYQDNYLQKKLDKMLAEKKLSQNEFDYLKEILGIAKEIRETENSQKKLMEKYIIQEPIYCEFLQYIIGVGSILSANLIKEFGYCEKAPHVSSMWRYAGLHVKDGIAAKLKKGEILDYNPRVKVLAWKLGDSFVKQKTPLYRSIYDSERARQTQLIENKKNGAPKNQLQAHRRAVRKMVKIFLEHYWVCARELAGLKVSKPYPMNKLGHSHYIDWKEAVKRNSARRPAI